MQYVYKPYSLLMTLLLSACALPSDDPSSSPDWSLESASLALETQWTDCAAEWQHCAFTGTRQVRYGINGTYAPLRTYSNGVACRNDSFGGDPVVGTPKRCWVAAATTTPPPTTPPPTTPPPTTPPPSSDTWVDCAAEWQHCAFTGTRQVRYGVNGTYAPVRTFSNGVACRNDNFGGDPVPGATKRCAIATATTAPPPTTPPPTTPPPTSPPPTAISALIPYSTSNPIVYTNDHPEDVHTDVIMMALQSNGTIDLRGMVTDQQASPPGNCSGDGCHTIAIDDTYRRQFIEAARASGFVDIPQSVSGAAGASLIVSEARAASTQLPLVIMTGGPLGVVAEAYRRDPSIAQKVIVVIAGFALNQWTNGKYRGETNITQDEASAKTVLENLRCVVIPFADFNSQGIDQTRYPATPRWRVDGLPNKPLRASMQRVYAYPWAHYDADGGPQATLLSASYATAGKRVRWTRDAAGPFLQDDASSDDVLITSVNGGAATERWWSEVNRAFGVR